MKKILVYIMFLAVSAIYAQEKTPICQKPTRNLPRKSMQMPKRITVFLNRNFRKKPFLLTTAATPFIKSINPKMPAGLTEKQ
ncbi:hypothetical protein [Flavobacterium sp. 3HN19-14]|uniref:hypothetical protein n=1 Tax=Flavobacterium sp. 3HN19-14 TaxID=3448133 RepID=UPI003EE20960